MENTSVSSKGQVTIPRPLRQKLGIRKGSKISFKLVGDHIELRVESSPVSVSSDGFGMLKSRHKSVPVDFDPASLFQNDRS